MNQERIMQVILAPVISEKSNLLAEKRNQVAFKVLPNATKKEIKASVELLFGVKVAAVSTANVQGKAKRFGNRTGKRQDWKKAYVSLLQGQELDLESAVTSGNKE